MLDKLNYYLPNSNRFTFIKFNFANFNIVIGANNIFHFHGFNNYKLLTRFNFIAFLNLMGVRLQAPQPARALLQFTLVRGAPAQLVMAGTPVSSICR